MIFCRRMFSGFDTDFYEQSIMPLTTPYHFIREDGINVNREWLLEHYRSNFVIQVK